MDKITIYLKEPESLLICSYNEDNWELLKEIMCNLADPEINVDTLIVMSGIEEGQEYIFWARNVTMAHTS